MSDEINDRRIRVLTLTRDLAVKVGAGGAERLAYEFAAGLDRARFESYLCLTHKPEPAWQAATDEEVDELQDAGVCVLRLERNSTLQVMPWLMLYRLLVAEKIDVVHAHMPRASVPGTIIARMAKVPVMISHEHGWAFEGKPLRVLLDRCVVARGDAILAVSEHDRRKMIEVERLPPALVRVLPNGIETPAAGDPETRRKLGVEDDVALVGAVGRLVPEKAHADLIKAMALLRGESRRVRCVIIGDGPELRALTELTQSLRISDDVQLLGARDDVLDLISALDVAVICSRHEGSPLAVLEYMAVGVPIVATAVGGIPELIDDGVHGVLVEQGRPPALAGAIARLLDDEALAKRLGEQAQQRQRAEYALEVVVRRLEALYLELSGADARQTPDRLTTGSSRR